MNAPRRRTPRSSKGRKGAAPGRVAAPRSSARPSAPPAASPARPAPGGFGRVAGGIVAVWALLFLPQLTGQRAFVLGDAPALRPYAEFSAARWQERHERTHWNPYLFTGIPATVSLQDTRPQYLPDALLSSFDAVHRLPAWPPLAIPLALHLAGMLCAAALARSLWGAGPLATAWAGLAWGLMPNLIVPFTYGHDAQLMATSLVPAVLLGIDRVMTAPVASRALGAAVALAGTIGALLLAAYPQVVVLLLPLAAAFAVERAIANRRFERLAHVAAAAGLGAAIGAAVWWPGLLYNAHSVRGGGIAPGEVARWSLAWRDLAATAWPWAVGFGGPTYWGGLQSTDFPQYLGATVLMFAALGWGRGGRHPGAASLFGVATVLATLLALGARLGAVYEVLWRLPLWSSFRLAVNALTVAQLGVALLSARGLDRLLRQPAAIGPWARRVMAGLVIVALAGALGLGLAPHGAPWSSWARSARPALTDEAATRASRRAALDLALRTVLAGAALGAVVLAGRRRPALAGACALALMAGDLALVDGPFLRSATGDLATLEHRVRPAWVALAAAEPRQRVLSAGRLQFFWNDWIRWRVRGVGGYHPAVNRAWDELLKLGLLGSPEVLRGLAVKYVVGAPGVPDSTRFVLAGPPGAEPVWRVKGALPRAYAVPLVSALPAEMDVVRALASPGYDAAAVAFAADAAAAGAYPGSTACALRWIADEPDRLALETEAPDRAFVVVADAYFPGWTASLDGRPWALYRVNHLVRGVALPAGRHQLTMRYVPEGWRVGEAATRAGLAVALAALLIGAASGFGRRSARNPGRDTGGPPPA